MKIIVCGIPPAQSRSIERRFADHEVIVLGAQDPVSRYLSHMVACDLCVVNTSLISHKMIRAVHAKMRKALLVKGPSSAVAAINNALGRTA